MLTTILTAFVAGGGLYWAVDKVMKIRDDRKQDDCNREVLARLDFIPKLFHQLEELSNINGQLVAVGYSGDAEEIDYELIEDEPEASLPELHPQQKPPPRLPDTPKWTKNYVISEVQKRQLLSGMDAAKLKLSTALMPPKSWVIFFRSSMVRLLLV